MILLRKYDTGVNWIKNVFYVIFCSGKWYFYANTTLCLCSTEVILLFPQSSHSSPFFPYSLLHLNHYPLFPSLLPSCFHYSFPYFLPISSRFLYFFPYFPSIRSHFPLFSFIYPHFPLLPMGCEWSYGKVIQTKERCQQNSDSVSQREWRVVSLRKTSAKLSARDIVRNEKIEGEGKNEGKWREKNLCPKRRKKYSKKHRKRMKSRN